MDVAKNRVNQALGVSLEKEQLLMFCVLTVTAVRSFCLRVPYISDGIKMAETGIILVIYTLLIVLIMLIM
jgi:hypothetical protein